MATIKPRGQVVKNLKQWIKKIPTTKRINPSEFHNVCHSLKVDIEFATEGLEEIKFCLRENGQSNKADAIGKLYNQLLSSVSTEYHKRSDGLAPMYLELSSAKKNAEILLAELKKIKPAKTKQAKRRSIIGRIVEVIIALALLAVCSYVFGVVTGIFIFVALLTIFHLLGWLEPIKAFIYRIFWPK